METPKEKAEELVYKFYNKQTNINQWGVSDMQKEFALIAVDEIINLLTNDINSIVNYWFEVKKEIELL
jgi:hypothetical protein